MLTTPFLDTADARTVVLAAVRGRFNVLVKHDARGFRVQEFAKSEAPNVRNLYVYGDSFTWGWGVQQGEMLADVLNRDLADWRVHNRGINASGTVLQYTLFETDDLEQTSQGDAVVVMFCFNDYRDNVGHEDEVSDAIVDGTVVRQAPQESFQSPIRTFLRHHVYLYSMGSATMSNLRRRFESTEESERVPTLDASDPAEIITRHFLAQFKKKCDDSGVRFSVATVPAAIEFGEPAYGFDMATADRYRQLISGTLDDEGIECIDLLPYFLYAKKLNPGVGLTI